ncbi:MAG: uroporphyrinogen decarboxylase family protein [Planctomycetota bacterium]
MNGREKIEAAFTSEGTSEIPAVICYERLVIRDHWQQLSDCPWWYWYSPNIKQQLQWRAKSINAIGQDWFSLWSFYDKSQQQQIIEVRDGDAFLVNKSTGEEKKLAKLKTSGQANLLHSCDFPQTKEAIDCCIKQWHYNKGSEFLKPTIDFDRPQKNLYLNGRGDLALALNAQFGRELFSLYHISSPLWSCFPIFGFENTMMHLAANPESIRHACSRNLEIAVQEINFAKKIGAKAIWIEECMTDSISPVSYKEMNLPFLRQLTDQIRSSGLKSIYYYCGNPADKWDLIMDSGADALSFEESKKSFSIDIEEVISRVKGKFVVLGNLDAVGVMQDGTEEQVKIEVKRQIATGRKNNSRFIMSLGSPVTPATPISKIRRYCDLVHET